MAVESQRVLIVSPRFPPINAADMHRVRMLLPYLRENGWAAEVLAAAPEVVPGPRDEWLAECLPADVPVHHAGGLGLAWTRIPGLGSLAARVFRAMERAGDRLLATGKFDLIYFSTTEFPLHLLGPRWKQKHGTPYAMDFQDPWVNDYYREHPEVVPPGGRLKFGVIDRFHRWAEPRALAGCCGVTAVSAAYLEQLRKRYSAMAPKESLVAPFPGAARDFAQVERAGTRQGIFDPGDGGIHWVYAGRGGPDMARSVRGIFRAVRQYAPAALRERLRLHFVGTSYAAAGRGTATIAPIATEFGLERQVFEHTDRIPYAETLRCLRDATALLVPGSDDSSYTASKIYPYLLARRPLLAVFHEQSSVVDLMRRAGGGVCVPFATDTSDEALAAAIGAAWITSGRHTEVAELSATEFAPYTDEASARELAGFLRRALASGNGTAG